VADAAGLTVYRTTEVPERSLRVARRLEAGGLSALAVHGRLLLASTRTAGAAELIVYDARRGDVQELARAGLAGPARHLAADGNRVFASLGRVGQVSLFDITDPAVPAGMGALVLQPSPGTTWVSAEQALVAGEIVWVAAGGGKLQRFRAPVGEAPVALDEKAIAFGDVRSAAFMGRYLLAGTLVLDANGTPLELPLPVGEPSRPIAGALASVALDHVELRSTRPAEAGLSAVAEPVEVVLSELADSTTAGAVTLETRPGGLPVPVTRRLQLEADGARLVLMPMAPLATGSEYLLRIGAGLADLGGRSLSADAMIRPRPGFALS